jgi:hypothetical protein
MSRGILICFKEREDCGGRFRDREASWTEKEEGFLAHFRTRMKWMCMRAKGRCWASSLRHESLSHLSPLSLPLALSLMVLSAVPLSFLLSPPSSLLPPFALCLFAHQSLVSSSRLRTLYLSCQHSILILRISFNICLRGSTYPSPSICVLLAASYASNAEAHGKLTAVSQTHPSLHSAHRRLPRLKRRALNRSSNCWPSITWWTDPHNPTTAPPHHHQDTESAGELECL